MKTALTIAGSDCSGGAGIQADIKTMTMHGVYAMSAVTALTAQNTVAISDLLETPPDFLEEQLESIFSDILPDAVKIGMIATEEQIDVIAKVLQKYKAQNIVIDPVLSASTGKQFTSGAGVKYLGQKLFPLAKLITPNIPEAEKISGIPIYDKNDIETAAKHIFSCFGCSVLIKGGHFHEKADDFLYNENIHIWFQGERIPNPNTHGTGCTLSSAIASNLAKGNPLEESVRMAKKYLTDAIRAMLDLGMGSGPLNHCFSITGK